MRWRRTTRRCSVVFEHHGDTSSARSITLTGSSSSRLPWAARCLSGDGARRQRALLRQSFEDRHLPRAQAPLPYVQQGGDPGPNFRSFGKASRSRRHDVTMEYGPPCSERSRRQPMAERISVVGDRSSFAVAWDEERWTPRIRPTGNRAYVIFDPLGYGAEIASRIAYDVSPGWMRR